MEWINDEDHTTATHASTVDSFLRARDICRVDICRVEKSIETVK